MRRVDKAREAFGKPMVAPRLPAVTVHPLLHDGPVTVVGHDEAVQVEVEPVLHRRAVDLRDKPARRGERRAIEADPHADIVEFMRGSPRMSAAATAYVNAEFAGKRCAHVPSSSRCSS